MSSFKEDRSRNLTTIYLISKEGNNLNSRGETPEFIKRKDTGRKLRMSVDVPGGDQSTRVVRKEYIGEYDVTRSSMRAKGKRGLSRVLSKENLPPSTTFRPEGLQKGQSSFDI